jgi:hypothetical protein
VQRWKSTAWRQPSNNGTWKWRPDGYWVPEVTAGTLIFGAQLIRFQVDVQVDIVRYLLVYF